MAGPGSWPRRLRGRTLAQLPGLTGVNGFAQQESSGAVPSGPDSGLGLVSPPPPVSSSSTGRNSTWAHGITNANVDTVTTTELAGMAIAGFAAGLVGIALALWVRKLKCTRTLLTVSKSWKVILSRQLSASGALEEQPATAAMARVPPALPAPAPAPAPLLATAGGATDAGAADQRSQPIAQLPPPLSGPAGANDGAFLPPAGQVAGRDGPRL
ncbi:hypothetical protein HXX76_008446 [Chlamydomonas incerta]|uniref:Uncharacterized protein n=1 Tax=Chlamydomonas incerta TaxID=51695 RepID=A0A835T895_CHLIN|nr:hypothetical protein HXX76_008446 [Chlamydomonas incerta]|eukprot:KAG2433386.1 hypothetical protein HXX76_008446 [Chlamydomonas incerta]